MGTREGGGLLGTKIGKKEKDYRKNKGRKAPFLQEKKGP